MSPQNFNVKTFEVLLAARLKRWFENDHEEVKTAMAEIMADVEQASPHDGSQRQQAHAKRDANRQRAREGMRRLRGTPPERFKVVT